MTWFKILYFWYHYTDKGTTRYKEGVADGVQGLRSTSKNLDYGIGYSEGTALRSEACEVQNRLESANMRLDVLRGRAALVRRAVAENL